MKRTLALVVLSAALALPAMGCRNAHLGPNVGDSYREAVAAQREGDGSKIDDMSATDAMRVLQTHRGAQKPGARGRSRSTSSSSSSAPALDIGGGWQGASGNIRLDAK